MTVNYTDCPAHLTPPEREWLKEAAEDISKRFPLTPMGPLFVHIGVMYGGSLHCSRAGAPKAPILGVDLNIKGLRGDPQAFLLEGNSILLGWNFEAPIHFLFIDGGHDYATVRMDVEAWGRLVVVGGIMAYHDSDYHHVVRAIKEWWPGASKTWVELKLTKPGTDHTALRIRAFQRRVANE
jgi:hypothetical protein